MKLKGLYAITDTAPTPEQSLLDKVKAAISGGAGIIQLRAKEKTDRELLDIARNLCLLCKEMGSVFIVNDRVELAQRVSAHGVHIGKEDTDLSTVRRMLPRKIIGVSCYNSLDAAVEMEKKGADYVAFGSLFPSPTKPEAVHAPLSLLKVAKKRLTVPICAIGGITPENTAQVVEAGAAMVAVISGLWCADDIFSQAQRFARQFLDVSI